MYSKIQVLRHKSRLEKGWKSVNVVYTPDVITQHKVIKTHDKNSLSKLKGR